MSERPGGPPGLTRPERAKVEDEDDEGPVGGVREPRRPHPSPLAPAGAHALPEPVLAGV
jgi:hypothetical protein